MTCRYELEESQSEVLRANITSGSFDVVGTDARLSLVVNMYFYTGAQV